MAEAFEYTGQRDGNIWMFHLPAEFNLGGESVALDWRTSVSLSEKGVERLLRDFRGGGPNQEGLYLSIAVGEMLNSLAPGLVREFEIQDEHVDRYLSEICAI